MSNIIVGNRGGRGCAATAITVALILIASSPAILTTTTTEAFATTKIDKGCKDIQFQTLHPSYLDDEITIETSQDEYSVDLDYLVMLNTEGISYHKNVAAKDPRGRVLLPGGETITITVQTIEDITGGYRTSVTLYNNKVSDCGTFSGPEKVEDKMALKIVSIEQTDEPPWIAKLTVQVPDASDVDKHFTKLLVSIPLGPEHQEYYLISHRVQVR